MLLHGLTATRRYVVMGSRALERAGHRVVAYDARAHGQSDGARDPRTTATTALAADLLAVLDDRGIDRAVLAGASMGAHTLTTFALEHPERVAGARDHDPGLRPRASTPRRWSAGTALAEGPARAAASRASSRPTARRRCRRSGTRRSTACCTSGSPPTTHPEALADALQAVPRSRPFEDWGDLARDRRADGVVASRDEVDPEHPYAIGERYAEAIPDARLVSEDEGDSPLAWQGAQVSKVISEVADSAATAP